VIRPLPNQYHAELVVLSLLRTHAAKWCVSICAPQSRQASERGTSASVISGSLGPGNQRTNQSELVVLNTQRNPGSDVSRFQIVDSSFRAASGIDVNTNDIDVKVGT